MKALDWLARRLGYAKPRAPSLRSGFSAADYSRLTSSLASETEYINTTLRYQLHTLRARSRQAAQNNPFARRFVALCVDNIAGPDPFRLQSKVRYRSGALDETTNRKIEDEWRLWGRRGSVEVTGEVSLRALLRLIVRTWATDGEVLIRKVRGRVNRHGLALQVLDTDRLDEQKNEAFKGGGGIHMGIERDAIGRPVAYHILKRRPADWQGLGYSRDTERIPAEDIIHLYVPEHAEQSRGVPPMYAALLNLVHLGAFSEAAVIAARVGASQMGIITSPDGAPPTFGDGTDAQQNPQISADPGSFPVLPQGYTLESWSPKYPDAAVEPFIRSLLMGMSAGLNVAYHSLSADLTGVNFSSGRLGEMDEREHWEGQQNWMIEHLMEPLYEDWTSSSLMTGALPAKFFDRPDQLLSVKWVAKRWRHIQPREETEANIAQIQQGLKSRTQCVAETGGDIEDVLQELAQEQTLAQSYGLTLGAAPPAPAPEAPEPEEADDDEEDEVEDAEERAARLAFYTRETPAPVVNITTPPVELPGGQVNIHADLEPLIAEVKALQAATEKRLADLLAAQAKQGEAVIREVAQIGAAVGEAALRLEQKPEVLVRDARGRTIGRRVATAEEAEALRRRH